MTNDAPLVLVVDDDPDMLDMIRFLLEGAGYRTQCLGSVGQAIKALEEATPDCIVSDLMMGELDAGFTFARRVKEDARLGGVPILMVTAVGSQRGFDFAPRTDGDLAAMNIDAFLTKPLDPQAFKETIAKLLR